MEQQILTLGIDLGGTKILTAVVDGEGRILSRVKKRTRVELGPDAILDRIVRAAREAVQDAGVELGKIVAIGIGTPGPINPVTGIVIEAPNLGWKNVNLKAYLEKHLGAPTSALNDVNAGTWGEYMMGAGRGSSSCVGVFVGTGIGSGIVIDGKLYEGAGHYAGEIGHICIDPNGPLCGCGHKGCLEAFASRTAMTRDIWNAVKKGEKTTVITKDEKQGAQIRSKQIKKAYDSGDKVICRVLDRAAEYLGLGLASTANLLNPERIILGGGVVEALGQPFLMKIQAAIERRAFKPIVDTMSLKEAELGDDAGVLGAALIARDSLKATLPTG